MKFHPVTLLNTTHKITSITANFMGTNKLSQSILPLFLPAFPGPLHIPRCPGFSQQENKWRISANSPWRKVPGAPGDRTRQNTKPLISVILQREFGSFTLRAAGIARCARCPQVIHMLLWITLVEFGSFSVLVAQRCSSRFEQTLSLPLQPYLQLV